ncbi:MAG: hypothetical protein M3N31_04085, partial [Actinomycetota bacterium]|nr:hypothetical protein [Actinomycetota bacterium]
GLLVPVGDPKACFEAVLRLGEDDELRSHLIANGLETARAHAFERNSAVVRASVERAFPALATGAGMGWDSAHPGAAPVPDSVVVT